MPGSLTRAKARAIRRIERRANGASFDQIRKNLRGGFAEKSLWLKVDLADPSQE
jgi:hypothetical protein